MTKLEENASLFFESTYKIKHSAVSSLYTALEMSGEFDCQSHQKILLKLQRKQWLPRENTVNCRTRESAFPERRKVNFERAKLESHFFHMKSPEFSVVRLCGKKQYAGRTHYLLMSSSAPRGSLFPLYSAHLCQWYLPPKSRKRLLSFSKTFHCLWVETCPGMMQRRWTFEWNKQQTLKATCNFI